MAQRIVQALQSMDFELLTEQFCDYALYIRANAKGTIKRFRQIIGWYAKTAEIKHIQDVTNQNLRQLFVSGRSERNWKSSTFIAYYHSLSSFFKWCVKNNYLTANPLEGIDLPRIEKKLPTKLSKMEALKLLEIVYNYPYNNNFLRCRNHAIFSTLIFAGLRKGELFKLTLTDVDIENLTIFVRQGKGSKDRLIPMSFTLAQSLKRYLVERKKLGKTCPQFFVSINRNVGFEYSGLKRLITKMRSVSNIKFTAHKLRHTFATLMLEGGCDIYSLSRMMGHSNITTTTIYLSATAEHLRSQVSKHPLNDTIRL
ncbi:MAG: tyrosine-type recombinase/integrase [Bacteroidetes bacterium]|nr:tyrosine-type recombinase/integrase [Bacteroidota bacterium]